MKPEIFEAHGLEWYRHTPGDPMPCAEATYIKWLNPWEVSGEYLDLSALASSPAIMWAKCIGWRPAGAPAKLSREASEAITLGSIVRLKSGSPPMTVIGTDGAEAICLWAEDRGFFDKRIPLAALKLAN